MKLVRRFFKARFPHLSLGFEEKEGLFRYTSGRWLYNEKEQCALRYVKFNVEGAQEMACKALGATRCTHFIKLIEGSYNKVFELRFDNDAEAILRIPCPVSGPPHWSTASEVATLEFVRQELDIPAPRVLSWSSKAESSDNYLGTEYILMDRVKAVDAFTRWESIQKAEASPLIVGLYEIEQKLARLQFSSIGSLYYKEDLEGLSNSRPLFAPDAKVEARLKQAGDRYRIGPFADRHWWRGDRTEMDLDYGPWDNMAGFLMASARNERIWIESSRQRDGIKQRILQPKEQDLYYRILRLYEAVIPHIIPKYPLAEPTLWHPDVSLSNILVPKQGPATIASLIDWQGAFTGPYCTQAVFPEAFGYEEGLIDLGPGVMPPKLPADFASRPKEEQEKLRLHLKFAMRHKYYMYLMSRDPLRLEASQLPHTQVLSMLPYWAVRSWGDGLVRMIYALLEIREKWDSIVLDERACPIEISAEEEYELRALIRRSELYDVSIEILNKLLDAGGDGWVANDHYETAKGLLEQAKAEWDEYEMGGPFPYEDEKYSFFLS